MIDIHSHLIPNIDDGSKSINETIELIKEAEKEEFTDIILTPHYMVNEHESNVNEIQLWNEKLQEILYKESINIQLHTGMEVYITENIIELLSENKLLTLANSKYLLIELPLNSRVYYAEDLIFKLLQKNIVPIIAHPERYRFIQEKPEKLKDYIKSGCMIQSNYGSILGVYGRGAKKTIKYLLKNDLIDFLGSDTHRKSTIYPKIQKAKKKIKKIIGERKLMEITQTNAEKMLENK